jgi:hypothetical protein
MEHENDRWEITAAVKTGIRTDLDSMLAGLAALPDVDAVTFEDG